VRIQTNLTRRGAIYYFRTRIPADLVPHYKRLELVISLKTTNKQEAISKARFQRLKLDHEFTQARALILNKNTNNIEVKFNSEIWDMGQNTYAPASFTLSNIREHHSLEDLLDYWIAQRPKRANTILEAKTAIKRLSELTTSKSALSVTKYHIVTLKDLLIKSGKSPATVQSQINLLRAIFQTAVDNDKLPKNPAAGVRAPIVKPLTKSRIPFSTKELETIFNSSIYTQGERPKAGAGEASFWIPLLALWSGARLEELGQLHVDDIQVESCIHYIHITTEGGDKNLKTMSSKRRVPIHPELLKYGFMVYVESIKREGHKRLFPLLTAAEGRPKTAGFSKWFGRHLRKTLKIEDSRKVFHSFRHGFKDACRISGVLSEHHDRLTGHSNNSVGDSYGGEHYPLKPLNEAIIILHYENLNLSHLYKTEFEN